MGQCASEPRNSDTQNSNADFNSSNVVKLSDYESDFETSEDEQISSMGSKSIRRSKRFSIIFWTETRKVAFLRQITMVCFDFTK